MYEMRNVGVTRGGRPLLDGVSLTLGRGMVCVIVGPNGAGKSTLLKVLAGEMRPDSGAILLDGVPLQNLPPPVLARRRAVLPQHTEVAFSFRVGEVVALGMSPSRERDVRVDRLLERVDLPGFASRLYESLSGGERQRVQLARVLAQLERGPAEAPGFLLLDEPTASLDLAHQLLVLDVARAHAQAGGGVLAILHDLNLAAMCADEMIALKGGRIVAAGAPADVLTDTLLLEAFGVRARVNGIPAGPFVLPQSIRLEGA